MSPVDCLRKHHPALARAHSMNRRKAEQEQEHDYEQEYGHEGK